MNFTLSIIVFALLFAIASVVYLSSLFHARFCKRITQITDDVDRLSIARAVQRILSPLGRGVQEVLIGEDEAEYICPILASTRPLIWARVRITKITMRVFVEYLADLNVTDIQWAERIVSALRQRGVHVYLVEVRGITAPTGPHVLFPEPRKTRSA